MRSSSSPPATWGTSRSTSSTSNATPNTAANHPPPTRPHRPAGQQPRQRGLCRGGADFGADGLYLVDDAQVALEVLAGEARVGLAPVVVGEVVDGADLPGQQAVTEGRVGNEPDTELAQQRQDLGLDVAGPQ